MVVLGGKNPPANAGDTRDLGLIPGSGSGRSLGGGHGNPLQYSCLENPVDRGAWWAIVCRISKSQTHLKWLRIHIPVLCCCSVAQSCPTVCDPMDMASRLPCPSPSPRGRSNSCPLSQWCHAAVLSYCPLSSCLLSFPGSGSLVTSWLFTSGTWSKYWSPSNDYSGLISFRIDRFDLLAVQRTLKSLLQHHSSKASILWCSALFMVQLSHPYMITRKTYAICGFLLFILYMVKWICQFKSPPKLTLVNCTIQ